MPDQYTDQLSAYLDGELGAAERRRLEAHLADCAECTATLRDLRAILAAAPRYPGREPSRGLWSAIEARLDEPEVIPLNTSRLPVLPSSRPPVFPSSRRFTWPHLIAAGLLMAALGGGTVWMVQQHSAKQYRDAALRQAAETSAVAIQPPVLPSSRLPDSAKTAAYAEAQYDAAVHDLEQVLAAGRSRLDTATVRTVEQSLQRIDVAIAEARAAIQRDPANAYLSRQIASNMRRKLNLLRAATNAIAART